MGGAGGVRGGGVGGEDGCCKLWLLGTRPQGQAPFFLWGSGEQHILRLLPSEDIVCLTVPGQQVHRVLPPTPGSSLPSRAGRAGSTNGDACWQIGSSIGQSLVDT